MTPLQVVRKHLAESAAVKLQLADSDAATAIVDDLVGVRPAGVPEREQALTHQAEAGASEDGVLGPVAGLPDAGNLLGLLEATLMDQREAYRSTTAGGGASTSAVSPYRITVWRVQGRAAATEYAPLTSPRRLVRIGASPHRQHSEGREGE